MPGPARAMVLLCEFWSSMRSQIRCHVVPFESESVIFARNSSSCSLNVECKLEKGSDDSEGHALVLPDVALLLCSVLLVELVNGALGFGDGLLSLPLRRLVARLDLLRLPLPPLPTRQMLGLVYKLNTASMGHT